MDDQRELEVIHHQMEQTRESLVEKLEALENTFQEKVEGASKAVTSTVEAVEDTVQTVKQTVTEAFDLSAHVRRHPCAMFGGAFALGCLGGYLLGGSRETAPASTARNYPDVTPPTTRNGHHAGNGHALEAPPAREPEEKEEGPLAAAMHQLQGLAVGALMGLLREAIAKAIPTEWSPDVESAVDDMTTRLGGKPLRRLEPAGNRFS